MVISFFLDYHKLAKGSSMFIDAGVPHAYIRGECLEIMKNSDNVCRLGLTPKLKDTTVMKDVLVEEGLGIQVIANKNHQTHRFNQKTYEN